MKTLNKKKLIHILAGHGTCFNPETVWDKATGTCVERTSSL